METAGPDINARLATRLRSLRGAQGLTLDRLAELAGVSRSVISLIERAESSPTASVLDRLAAALGISLASLFAEEPRADARPLSHRDDQVVWRDPETGYLRRNLSPAGFPSPLELVEIVLPARARVAYDTAPRATPLHQQLWILDGRVEVTHGETVHRLSVGDCLAMRVDRPTAFRNPGRAAARYLLALTSADVRAGASAALARPVT